MAKTVADDYLRRIPKAELHCHLAGTLRATTVAELAQRAGLALPRPADKLYQWPDFYGFLDVLRLTALVLRTPGDFARAVYEYVEDAVRDGNLKHVEFFFNPDYFYPNGIDYPSMVDGIVEGIEAARKKFGVSSLLICCIDRSTNTPRPVGLQTGGVALAEQLAATLAEVEGATIPVGTLDVAFYRDDIGLRPVLPEAATDTCG